MQFLSWQEKVWHPFVSNNWHIISFVAKLKIVTIPSVIVTIAPHDWKKENKGEEKSKKERKKVRK